MLSLHFTANEMCNDHTPHICMKVTSLEEEKKKVYADDTVYESLLFIADE